MSSEENTVGGTYRDGHIVLDRPMPHWAEGTRVYVQLLPEGHLTAGVWPDDGSESGQAEIMRRWEEAEREEPPSEEEVAAFEAAIREVRTSHIPQKPKNTGPVP